MKSTGRIFLAHASEDKDAVRKLHARLAKRGFEPWLDEVDLIPGQNWRTEIPKAIRASDVFLAFLSKRSVEKEGYVQKEFRLALDAQAEKPADSNYLIPVKLDDCEVPDLELPQFGERLRDRHWVDLWRSDGFERLVVAIEHALCRGDGNGRAGSAPAADIAGLVVTGPIFAILEMTLQGRRFKSIHVNNPRDDKTFDDVRIELDLPAGVGFVSAGASRGQEPALNHVTIPISAPVHPGDVVKLGHVTKHLDAPCDADEIMRRLIGASRTKDGVDWKITARDVPASSGTLDVSELNRE